MNRAVLIDEYRVAFRVPRGLSRRDAHAVRTSLDGLAFRRKIGRAIRGVVAQFPALRSLQVRITR